ncbi:MAG: prepilin-type N-terminal cleavage/methylation domain-containing protein [Thermodesulfovibrionales bacterium]
MSVIADMTEVRGEKGVTLVELMVVITILAVMLAFATLSMVGMSRGAKLNEARDQLLADIQDAKLKSISGVPHAIVVSSTSYTVSKLKADDANLIKDNAADVDGTPVSTVSLPSGMTITGPGASELWFDRKGIPKSSSWGFGNCTFTLTKDGETRTIKISQTGRVQYEQ